MRDGAEDDDLSGPAARPFVADCIIANPPSFAHIHCAEKLGIPLHVMFTMPYSPTQSFPHPLANIQSSNSDPQLTNYISYAMIEVLMWQGLGDIINRFREKCLGLDPVSLVWAPGMLQRLKIPHTYCWSPALIPKPKDWGSHISISGFYFLDSATNYTPAPDLQTFLSAGPAPVYIGFGSIVLDDPDAMTELIFEAARVTGRRILLSKGWGGIGTEELRIPDGVFMLGNVPHDWLFKHVSCVVHHGGAGTTAAGITAGRPTVVVPFFGDQPFWGAMIARAGAGPDPIPHKQLTAERLADAINFCLIPQCLERAEELASKIATERGTDIGAQSFHQHLEIDRLRCTLAPSRSAAWRIKRTQIRLSPFAACTLANANLLDFHDLKLYRPQEYNAEEGPSDPVSGFATAAFGAISSMAMGVADFPAETVRALLIPFKSSEKQSEASTSTMAREEEASRLSLRSNIPVSSEQSSPSLRDSQESLARVHSHPNLSGLSTPTSNFESISTVDTFQSQPNATQVGDSSSRVRSRNDSGSGDNRDMLRQRGVHTSKGLGRIVRTAFKSPMDMSMSITEGFHNAPKLWGDDTVRPKQKVTDLKSGGKAVGKEFALGMYDGVTGLITQPLKGAQKEGAGGFLKGVGKGIGGIIFKPGAALFGIAGYSMKGVHKEIQKLFSRNVQNYIVASRTAQGYEEWLQSSEEEREDVIVRWRMIQPYLKKKDNRDEMMRDILKTQQKKNDGEREADQDSRRSIASFAQSISADVTILDHESAILAMGASQIPEEILGEAEINEAVRLSDQEILRRDAADDESMEPATEENTSQLQRQLQEDAYGPPDEEYWRQAMASSEAEARRHADQAKEYEQQLNQVMAQSLNDQRQRRVIDHGSDPRMDLGDAHDEQILEARIRSRKMAENAAAGPSGSRASLQQPPPYASRHLEGTTQSEFEAQQQGQSGEKTAQEKTEEEIVMAYIKKQSLLEIHHQGKGKGRAMDIEEEDDEDLQKALDLSMREQEHGRD
jgi:UDP:flavonoid glycosyltransferase YjiC (YdhE family)